jgi:hypothetical protein
MPGWRDPDERDPRRDASPRFDLEFKRATMATLIGLDRAVRSSQVITGG